MPERFEVAFDRPDGPMRVAGLFNFEDSAEDLTLPLPPGRWHAVELWDERYLGAFEGRIDFPLVAPHACRVIALRPVADAPALLATTAHIGMGALDVESSEYDGAAQTLRIGLTPAGRARRRVFFATGGLRAREARLGRQRLAIDGGEGMGSVELSIDAASELEVEFE